MSVKIAVTVPPEIVAAAERALKRAGVVDVETYVYKKTLRALLRRWVDKGLLHVAGEANWAEVQAQAIDRINARDAVEKQTRGVDL